MLKKSFSQKWGNSVIQCVNMSTFALLCALDWLVTVTEIIWGDLGSKPKWFDLSKHFSLAFIIRDFLFTLKGKSSWFIDVGDLPFDMKIAVFVLICLRGFLGTPKNQGKSMWIQFFMLFFHCWHVQFHFEELQLLCLCDCKGKYDLQFLHHLLQ